VFSPLKLSVVGLVLILGAAPAVSAQTAPTSSPRSSLVPIPKSRVRIGTPNALPGPRTQPWISERGSAPSAQPAGGPRLPVMVQPAVARLDADQPPAPADDVLIIPVTTILIALLVVLIVVAVD
jgi:hypothetical protein